MLLGLLLTVFCGAQAHDYELKVGEFNVLNVSDDVNVVWVANADSAGYARFSGADRFADAFIFTNNGKGNLKIQVSVEDVGDPELPTLYVYSNFLTEIKSTSALNVQTSEIPAAAELKLTLIGNGTLTVTGINSTRVSAKLTTGNGIMTLSGNTSKASLTMLGTGQIRADEMKANTVNCTIMGTGSIYTWAVESLSTKGIGSTTIYYRGEPSEIKKLGGGKLTPLASAPAQTSDAAPTEMHVGVICVDAEPAQTTEKPVQKVEEEEVEVEIEEEEEEPVTLPERRN